MTEEQFEQAEKLKRNIFRTEKTLKIITEAKGVVGVDLVFKNMYRNEVEIDNDPDAAAFIREYLINRLSAKLAILKKEMEKI